MVEPERQIIVGVLGQWGSGKSTAAETLVRHLGGEEHVEFITDRELLAGQTVDYIRGLEGHELKCTVDADGAQRLEGELATVYLGPGESLETVDLNTLLFDLHAGVYDHVPPGAHNWMDRARLALGDQIREKTAGTKPVVIEAGFGTNLDPKGDNPFSHTLSDLFARLDEAGVEPGRVKWILVEATYETRSERNRRRQDSVPAVEFDRLAADGGNLDPDQQQRLEEQGATIQRVPNNHDDVERFRADIVAAFEEMFGGVSPEAESPQAADRITVERAA